MRKVWQGWRAPTPAPTMHPRARAREEQRIEGLSVDRKGRILCTACGAEADRSHRCDPTKEWGA